MGSSAMFSFFIKKCIYLLAALDLSCFSLWCPLWLLRTGSRRVGWLQCLQQMDSVVAIPGLWGTGSVVVLHSLSCSKSRSGTEPVSPALAGRFLTTETTDAPMFSLLVCFFHQAQPCCHGNCCHLQATFNRFLRAKVIPLASPSPV